MWISVRARRCNISPRLRGAIEHYLRRTLDRDRDRIASVVVYLRPANIRGDEIEFAARIVVWSSSLGQIAANEVSTSIRTAVGQAARRVRRTLRERAKRKFSHSRLARHFEKLAPLRDELLEQ